MHWRCAGNFTTWSEFFWRCRGILLEGPGLMTDITINPQDVDYATFALTLGRLKEGDQAAAILRVKELLQRTRVSELRTNKSEFDEEAAFRSDIAAQVLQELVRAGKIEKLVRSDAE
jgi:hypothetical protein